MGIVNHQTISEASWVHQWYLFGVEWHVATAESKVSLKKEVKVHNNDDPVAKVLLQWSQDDTRTQEIPKLLLISIIRYHTAKTGDW